MGATKVGYQAVALFGVIVGGLTACSQEEAETPVAIKGEAIEVGPTSLEIEPSGPDLTNGAYVYEVAHCAACHDGAPDPDTGEMAFAAGRLDLIAGINSANITQDVETGIGGWSDHEIETVLRTGVRPDGTTVHGIMPFRFLKFMTDADMRDLIGYLQTFEPISNAVPRSELSEAGRTPFPDLPKAEDVGEVIARGAYLVAMAHCMACHTKPDENGVQDFENQLGTGGWLLQTPIPAIAANITPHLEDGIGDYSAEDIVNIFRTGKRPDGSELAPIMGTRGLEHIRQEDLEAIAAYLKWLPPRPTPLTEEE